MLQHITSLVKWCVMLSAVFVEGSGSKMPDYSAVSEAMPLTGSVFSPRVHPPAQPAAFGRRAVAVRDILMVKKMVEIFDTIMATATVRATIIASSSSTDTDTNATSARTRLRRVKPVQQTVRVVCRCSIMLGGLRILHSFTP